MPTQRREEKRDRRSTHVRSVGRCVKETPHPLAPLFICFFLPPRPALCKLGRPGVLFVLPEVLTLVLGPSLFSFRGLYPSLSFSHRHSGLLFPILPT